MVDVGRIVVGLDEVVRELHRHLGGGPLAGVVGAEHQEHWATVLWVADALPDLDGGQVTALDGTADGDPLGKTRVRHDELVDLRGEVGEDAVRVAAARDVGDRVRRGELAIGLDPLGLTCDQVGDADVPGEAVVAQQVELGLAVDDDLDVVVARVLRHIEAERRQEVLVGTGGRVHGDQLWREGL